MRLLLDTQLLLWSQIWPRRLTSSARTVITDEANTLWFSTVSLAEISTKHALGRTDFDVDPRRVRGVLLENGYHELLLTGDHACRVGDLPPIHRDPFDRLLVAQADNEGMRLLTADRTLARYGDMVQLTK